MPTVHAKLSASSAKRWLNCPGSIRASEGYPYTSSIYADEGTLAHAAAEEAINTEEISKQTIKKIDAFYEAHPELGGSSEEMLNDLSEYIDYVQEEYKDELRQDRAAKLMTEQMVDFSEYVPGGFGTSDVIIIRTGKLHIIDLKFGKGVEVSAEDNPQMKLYALGALAALDLVFEVEEVVMTIYQPRIGNISTSTISRQELESWGEVVVKPGAVAALKRNAPMAAGDWCQFCPHRVACKERAKVIEEMAKYRDSITLSSEDVANILANADLLVKFVDDIKEKALTDALQGEEIPGWKVVEGRSVRKFTGTENDIVNRAVLAGFKKPLLYETKMLTLSAIEKLMGKKTFAESMSDIVEKPAGKPTLVPESDKRPAIVNGSAIDDFAGED